MRLLFFPTAALVCCVSSGCMSENTRAYNAAQTFLTALSRGDSTGAQAVATKAARPNLAGFLKDSSSVRGEFTLEAAQLSEGAAEVPVTFTGTSPHNPNTNANPPIIWSHFVTEVSICSDAGCGT